MKDYCFLRNEDKGWSYSMNYLRWIRIACITWTSRIGPGYRKNFLQAIGYTGLLMMRVYLHSSKRSAILCLAVPLLGTINICTHLGFIGIRRTDSKWQTKNETMEEMNWTKIITKNIYVIRSYFVAKSNIRNIKILERTQNTATICYTKL